MFNALGEFLLVGMEYVNTHWVASYAITIVIFTIIFRLMTMPSDVFQRRQSARMQEHQPELKRIQERYASNPETMQRKTREYQKEHKISLTSGCLPLLITFFVFGIFLNGMRLWGDLKTAQMYLDTTKMSSTQEKEEYFKDFEFYWIANIWQPDSGFAPIVKDYEEFTRIEFDRLKRFLPAEDIATLKKVAQTEELKNKDLSKEERAELIEKGKVAYEADLDFVKQMYPGRTNGWFIMAVLAGLSMLLIQMMTQRLNPTQAAAVDPNQPAVPGAAMGKGMMWIMAAMWVVFCTTSNAAFAIYAITSNIVGGVVTLMMNWKNLNRLLPKKKEAEKIHG